AQHAEQLGVTLAVPEPLPLVLVAGGERVAGDLTGLLVDRDDAPGGLQVCAARRPRALVHRLGAPVVAEGLVVRAAHGVVQLRGPLPDLVPLRYRDRRRLGREAPPHLAIRAQRAEAGGGVEPPPVVQVLVDVAGDAARQ